MSEEIPTPEVITTPEEPKTFTQEQVNRMIDERISREGIREAKEKAKKYDELITTVDIEGLEKRAQDAEIEAENLRKEKEIASLVLQVSKELGVPSSILRGSTEEELRQHAEQIKADMPVYPVVHEPGGSTPTLSKDQILAIENDKERKAAIAANIELFS